MSRINSHLISLLSSSSQSPQNRDMLLNRYVIVNMGINTILRRYSTKNNNKHIQLSSSSHHRRHFSSEKPPADNTPPSNSSTPPSSSPPAGNNSTSMTSDTPLAEPNLTIEPPKFPTNINTSDGIYTPPPIPPESSTYGSIPLPNNLYIRGMPSPSISSSDVVFGTFSYTRDMAYIRSLRYLYHAMDILHQHSINIKQNKLNTKNHIMNIRNNIIKKHNDYINNKYNHYIEQETQKMIRLDAIKQDQIEQSTIKKYNFSIITKYPNDIRPKAHIPSISEIIGETTDASLKAEKSIAGLSHFRDVFRPQQGLGTGNSAPGSLSIDGIILTPEMQARIREGLIQQHAEKRRARSYAILQQLKKRTQLIESILHTQELERKRKRIIIISSLIASISIFGSLYYYKKKNEEYYRSLLSYKSYILWYRQHYNDIKYRYDNNMDIHGNNLVLYKDNTLQRLSMMDYFPGLESHMTIDDNYNDIIGNNNTNNKKGYDKDNKGNTKNNNKSLSHQLDYGKSVIHNEKRLTLDDTPTTILPLPSQPHYLLNMPPTEYDEFIQKQDKRIMHINHNTKEADILRVYVEKTLALWLAYEYDLSILFDGFETYIKLRRENMDKLTQLHKDKCAQNESGGKDNNNNRRRYQINTNYTDKQIMKYLQSTITEPGYWHIHDNYLSFQYDPQRITSALDNIHILLHQLRDAFWLDKGIRSTHLYQYEQVMSQLYALHTEGIKARVNILPYLDELRTITEKVLKTRTNGPLRQEYYNDALEKRLDEYKTWYTREYDRIKRLDGIYPKIKYIYKLLSHDMPSYISNNISYIYHNTTYNNIYNYFVYKIPPPRIVYTDLFGGMVMHRHDMRSLYDSIYTNEFNLNDANNNDDNDPDSKDSMTLKPAKPPLKMPHLTDRLPRFNPPRHTPFTSWLLHTAIPFISTELSIKHVQRTNKQFQDYIRQSQIDLLSYSTPENNSIYSRRYNDIIDDYSEYNKRYKLHNMVQYQMQIQSLLDELSEYGDGDSNDDDNSIEMPVVPALDTNKPDDNEQQQPAMKKINIDIIKEQLKTGISVLTGQPYTIDDLTQQYTLLQQHISNKHRERSLYEKGINELGNTYNIKRPILSSIYQTSYNHKAKLDKRLRLLQLTSMHSPYHRDVTGEGKVYIDNVMAKYDRYVHPLPDNNNPNKVSPSTKKKKNDTDTNSNLQRQHNPHRAALAEFGFNVDDDDDDNDNNQLDIPEDGGPHSDTKNAYLGLSAQHQRLIYDSIRQYNGSSSDLPPELQLYPQLLDSKTNVNKRYRIIGDVLSSNDDKDIDDARDKHNNKGNKHGIYTDISPDVFDRLPDAEKRRVMYAKHGVKNGQELAQLFAKRVK